MTTNDHHLLLKIGITLIPGIGPVIGKKLIQYFGSLEELFRQRPKSLKRISGMRNETVDALTNKTYLEKAEKELGFIEKHKIKPLFYLDENFPGRLQNCIDSPMMLYYRGNADLDASRIIAVVGTRNATEYGRQATKEIIEGLAQYKTLVISGLAYGIDSLAHKHSLDAGLKTVAVLAHGLDRIYPAQNKNMAGKMLHQGGLLTEFMSATKPDRENFPRRNRIVAGLSDAVLVIESAKKGGALITADIANSYNRDVFAVPGNIGNEFSEGCNFLIKSNRAALADSAAEIARMMGWEETKLPPRQKKLFIKLSEDEQKLLDLLRVTNEMGIDKLCLSSAIPTTRVASALLNLEFQGIVKCMPGKVYKLL